MGQKAFRVPTQDYRPLITLTAQLTGVKRKVVEDIVKHQFIVMRRWMKRPPTPVASFDYFGAIKPNLSAVVRHIGNLVRELRKDPPNKEELQEELRFWWNYRHRFLDYHYARKRKKTNKKPKHVNIKKDSGQEENNGVLGPEEKGTVQ